MGRRKEAGVLSLLGRDAKIFIRRVVGFQRDRITRAAIHTDVLIFSGDLDRFHTVYE